MSTLKNSFQILGSRAFLLCSKKHSWLVFHYFGINIKAYNSVTEELKKIFYKGGGHYIVSTPMQGGAICDI